MAKWHEDEERALQHFNDHYDPMGFKEFICAFIFIGLPMIVLGTIVLTFPFWFTYLVFKLLGIAPEIPIG